MKFPIILGNISLFFKDPVRAAFVEDVGRRVFEEALVG